MSEDQKDYTSISPSAKSLLLMKGVTNIPYAKETADLLQGPEIFDLNFDEKDFWFWIRVMHFENRYWTIDQLLKETKGQNILELSSGYSLRGLDLCVRDQSIHYIDTDLPSVIAVKQDLINKLNLNQNAKGNFELLPLNALNEEQFNDIVARFAIGPLTIVNEGLLMYLNLDEKKQLCKIIHSALKKRNGCWITADIYVKRTEQMRAPLPQSKSETAFFEKHNIEENKFENYEVAERFFKSEGFDLAKEATPEYDKLSAMPHLLKVLPEELRNNRTPPPKIQATWMLRAI